MTGNAIIIVNRDGQLIYSFSRPITFIQANSRPKPSVLF